VGYVRGFGEEDEVYPQGKAIHAFTQLTNSFDAPDNLAVILLRMNDIWFGDLEFKPTIDYIFIKPIPRFLWPNKPLVLGNMYIMSEYLPERFTDYTGEVVSPSMAGEMIVSGGVLFMAIWSFFLGLLFAVFYQRAHRKESSPLSIVLYIWLILNVFNVLRSGTGIISPFIVFASVAGIVIFCSRILKGMGTAAGTPTTPLVTNQVGTIRMGTATQSSPLRLTPP